MTRVVADEGGVVSIRDSRSSSRSGVALRGGRERAGDDEGVSVDVVEGCEGVGDGGVVGDRGTLDRTTTAGQSRPGTMDSTRGTPCELTASETPSAVEPSIEGAGTSSVGTSCDTRGGVDVVGGAATFDAWRADSMLARLTSSS